MSIMLVVPVRAWAAVHPARSTVRMTGGNAHLERGKESILAGLRRATQGHPGKRTIMS